MIEIVPLAEIAPAAVDTLLDRAFDPARRQRTAYKVRGPATALPAFSFAAREDGVLVGSIQCWPVRFTPDYGEPMSLVMVGPVAVLPKRQRDGIGRQLMDHALAALAGAEQDGALVLIGDPEYYGRFFGFTAERTGGWRLPGPIERHRLLAQGAGVPHESGELGPIDALPRPPHPAG